MEDIMDGNFNKFALYGLITAAIGGIWMLFYGSMNAMLDYLFVFAGMLLSAAFCASSCMILLTVYNILKSSSEDTRAGVFDKMAEVFLKKAMQEQVDPRSNINTDEMSREELELLLAKLAEAEKEAKKKSA
jgi:hypothetical protein